MPTSKSVAAARAAAAPVPPMPFEAIVSRLERIAEQLETGEIQLEAALGLFEEGVALCKQGGQRLDTAERKLERLLDSGATQPLAEADMLAPGEGV